MEIQTFVPSYVLGVALFQFSLHRPRPKSSVTMASVEGTSLYPTDQKQVALVAKQLFQVLTSHGDAVRDDPVSAYAMYVHEKVGKWRLEPLAPVGPT